MFHLLLDQIQHQPKGLREQSSARTVYTRICYESAIRALLHYSITTAISLVLYLSNTLNI